MVQRKSQSGMSHSAVAALNKLFEEGKLYMARKNPEYIKRYTREEPTKTKINFYKGEIRKLKKEKKHLIAEIKTLERALKESIERIEELIEDKNLEDLIAAEKETEKVEDLFDT